MQIPSWRLIDEIRGTPGELSLDVKVIQGDMDAYQNKHSNVEAVVSTMNDSLMSLNKRANMMQTAQRDDRLQVREATSATLISSVIFGHFS